MELWYTICRATGADMLQWQFMCNALLAILLMAPLFGIMSTMVVTGRMSFFSDALGHSAFTGINSERRSNEMVYELISEIIEHNSVDGSCLADPTVISKIPGFTVR